MAESVLIEFDENGDCSIESQGFVGPECDKALREIETALGQTTRRTKKPEYTRRQRAATRRACRATNSELPSRRRSPRSPLGRKQQVLNA